VADRTDSNDRTRLNFLEKGIAQIALVVKDLEKTVEQYYETFGIGPWHFYTYGKPLVRHMSRNGCPTEYKMRVALSYLGPLRIELIEQLEGDTVYKDFIEKHGYGVHHVGVLVDDMENALDRARTAGFQMTMDGVGFGADGDGHYAYLDTERSIGMTIELISRPDRRHQPEKTFPDDGDEYH